MIPARRPEEARSLHGIPVRGLRGPRRASGLIDSIPAAALGFTGGKSPWAVPTTSSTPRFRYGAVLFEHMCH
jgi:hypothetical protein